MNILVVSDKLYPDEYGGSCTVTYELIKRWQEENDVDIFTCYPEKKDNDRLFLGNVYRYFNKKHIIYSIYKMWQLLRLKKYDVVLTQSVLSWVVLYLANKKIAQNSYTVFHGPWHKEAFLKYEGNGNIIKKYILPKLMLCFEKKYAQKNNNFIFLSKYMMEELTRINRDVLHKSINVVSGGVDLDFYKRKYNKNDAKTMLGIQKEMKVIFSLRRLDKRMGLERLIDAVKMLPNDIRENTVLIIGGKGSYKTVLEKKAQGMGNQIRFEGFIPDEKINLFFCAADLFVVPTLDLEGFGLVNLEALAMEVPVLATPQGGMVELHNKFDNMYLTKENTIESLSDSIADMFRKDITAPVKEKDIAKYSWDNISQEYIDLFEKN